MVVAILLTFIHEGKPGARDPMTKAGVTHRHFRRGEPPVAMRTFLRAMILLRSLRAMSKTARDRVLPAPKTPAIHKSDLPVRMASNNAIETVKTCPSPWLLKEGDIHSSNCHGPHPLILWLGGKRDWLACANTKSSCGCVCLPEKLAPPYNGHGRIVFDGFRPVLCRIKETHCFEILVQEPPTKGPSKWVARR